MAPRRSRTGKSRDLIKTPGPLFVVTPKTARASRASKRFATREETFSVSTLSTTATATPTASRTAKRQKATEKSFSEVSESYTQVSTSPRITRASRLARRQKEDSKAAETFIQTPKTARASRAATRSHIREVTLKPYHQESDLEEDTTTASEEFSTPRSSLDIESCSEQTPVAADYRTPKATKIPKASKTPNDTKTPKATKTPYSRNKALGRMDLSIDFETPVPDAFSTPMTSKKASKTPKSAGSEDLSESTESEETTLVNKFLKSSQFLEKVETSIDGWLQLSDDEASGAKSLDESPKNETVLVNMFTNIKLRDSGFNPTRPLELTSGNDLKSASGKQNEELELCSVDKKPESCSSHTDSPVGQDSKVYNETTGSSQVTTRNKKFQLQAAKTKDAVQVDLCKDTKTPGLDQTNPNMQYRDNHISLVCECPDQISSNEHQHLELNQTPLSGATNKKVKGREMRQKLASKEIHIKLLENNVETLKEQVGMLMLEKEEFDAEKKKMIVDLKIYSSLVASPIHTPIAKMSKASFRAQQKMIQVLKTEVNVFQSKLEAAQQEKLELIQQAKERADLKKQITKLTIQHELDINNIAVLESFFVKKLFQERKTADQTLENINHRDQTMNQTLENNNQTMENNSQEDQTINQNKVENVENSTQGDQTMNRTEISENINQLAQSCKVTVPVPTAELGGEEVEKEAKEEVQSEPESHIIIPTKSNSKPLLICMKYALSEVVEKTASNSRRRATVQLRAKNVDKSLNSSLMQPTITSMFLSAKKSQNIGGTYTSGPLPTSVISTSARKKRASTIKKCEKKSLTKSPTFKTMEKPKPKISPKFVRGRFIEQTEKKMSITKDYQTTGSESEEDSENEVFFKKTAVAKPITPNTQVISDSCDEIQTPISTNFDFGDFSKGGSGKSNFNERQSQLVVYTFKDTKGCTLPTIEKACEKSANFARLWWGLLEQSMNKANVAAMTLRRHYNGRKLRKTLPQVIYNDV